MKTRIFILFCALSAYMILADDSPDSFIMSFLRDFKLPPRCPPHEFYKLCLSNCTTCEQRGQCEANCSQRGCDCTSNFYRMEPGGPCLPVAMCPKPKCGENEVFRECGPLCEKCNENKCRVIHCAHKCYCIEGYRRNDEGVCIPKNECPKQDCTAFLNESWAEEGPADEYCMPNEGYVLDGNDTIQEERCYCSDGYLRNAMGICMNRTFCSWLSCYGKEKYYDCIPRCNTTCRNYGDPDCVEDELCYPGCFCMPGFVMNDYRVCVLPEQCPKDDEYFATQTESSKEESSQSSYAAEASASAGAASSESAASAEGNEKAGDEDVQKDEDVQEDTDGLETTSTEDDQASSAYDDQVQSKASSSDDDAYTDAITVGYSEEEERETTASDDEVMSTKSDKEDSISSKKEKSKASKWPPKHKISKGYDDFENEK